jgi:hypothetical protein
MMLWFLKRAGLVFYILSAGSCGTLVPSMAHEHVAGESTEEARTIEWLRKWKRPSGDFAGIVHREKSCCYVTGLQQDCFPVDAVRVVDGVTEVKPYAPGKGQYNTWYPLNHGIEEHLQKDDRESPDGRSYVCIQGQLAVCYVAGSGT